MINGSQFVQFVGLRQRDKHFIIIFQRMTISRTMTEKEIKLIVLETIRECINETRNYPPDDYIDDFKETVMKMIDRINWEKSE